MAVADAKTRAEPEEPAIVRCFYTPKPLVEPMHVGSPKEGHSRASGEQSQRAPQQDEDDRCHCEDRRDDPAGHDAEQPEHRHDHDEYDKAVEGVDECVDRGWSFLLPLATVPL